MEASIDSYTQMRVGLSTGELDQLKQDRKISGSIWRYGRDVESRCYPLLIHLKEAERMKAYTLPRDLNKAIKLYVLHLIPQALEVIESEKFVGFDFISGETYFRKVLISREDIF